MTRAPAPRLLCVTACLVVAALAACGGGAPRTAAVTAPAATHSVHALASAPLPSQIPSAQAHEASAPDPNFDYGFVVQITPSGFHPHWLVTPCCSPVIWLNLTDQPTGVVFDALQMHSGTIAPGGSFVYTPRNVESIAYHSQSNASFTGVVQVNQTSEP